MGGLKIFLSYLVSRHVLQIAASLNGYGPIVNSTFSLFDIDEDVVTEHAMFLSAEEELYLVASSAPYGSDATLIVGTDTYMTFNSAGSPVCMIWQGGTVPSVLYNLSPFQSVGSSSALGKPTNHFRYISGNYVAGAQIDKNSGLIISLSDPSLMQSEVWAFSVFDNTTVDLNVFAVPNVCNDSAAAVAVAPNPYDSRKLAASPTPVMQWRGLGLLRADAADAALRGIPAWSERERPERWPKLPAAGQEEVTTEGRRRREGDDDGKAVRGAARGDARVYEPSTASLRDLPVTVDNACYAAPVRTQSSTCGGCWAFSTAAATEVVKNVKRGALSNASRSEHLSPQQLLDCVSWSDSTSEALVDCKGCNGGWPYTGMRHIIDHGIAAESAYPFMGVTGKDCLGEESAARTFPLADALYVAPKNETAMAAAVAEHGAVVAIINVKDGLETYSGGVFQSASCCSGAAKKLGYCLQHAVTVVGYGADEDGVEYWKVKNSFGASWGDGGYFLIAKGEDTCGIEDNVVVPIAA